MAVLNSSVRSAIIVLIACVVAVVAGFALSDPLDSTWLITLAVILGVPMLPFAMRWHHPILLLAWNFEMVLFFLRTQPKIRDVAILWSAGVILMQLAMDKKNRFQLHRPLLAPIAVMVVGVFIAILSNHSLGAVVGDGLFGGKRYLHVLSALVGLLVLGAVRIPQEWRLWAGWLFVLAGGSYALGDFFHLLGAPGLIQVMFPSMISYYEGSGYGAVSRFAGVGWAAMSMVLFLQMRYGVRGLMDLSRPWIALGYVLFFGISLVGGHRVAVILPATVFLVQFFREGLYRTRYAAYLGVGSAVLLGSAIVFSAYLPQSVQRALSFLPGQKSMAVLQDAQGTFEWRLEMWKTVFPQVPDVMWTGKGFLYSPTDQELARLGSSRYIFASYESALVDGTYHQGFLTVIVPLGIITFLGFLWLLWVGWTILRDNLRHGDPVLRRINQYLAAAYLARGAFYFVFYGQFDTDLQVFAGLIGLSMALNGGVLRAAPAPMGIPIRAASPVPA